METKKDFLLKLFVEVTKSDMLHLGYWDRDDEILWDKLPDAQTKYVDKVLEIIPKAVKTVLDVGCGTGNTAYRLKQLGYSVDCVSPDLLQKEAIEKKYGGQLKFYCSKFEELNIEKTYDLILMMESCGYIRLDYGLKQADKFLNPDGAILISDFFRINSDKDYKNFHILDVFLAQIKEHNFEVVATQDITLNVLPTVELASKIYHTYILPVSETLFQSVISSMGKNPAVRIRWTILKFLFKKKINKLFNDIQIRIPKLLDRENFLEKIKYKFFLIERCAKV